MSLRSSASSPIGVFGSLSCRTPAPVRVAVPIRLCLALIGCSLLAQVAQAQWAFGVGGTNSESGQALAVMSNGDVIVSGWSTPEADWDPSGTTEAFVSGGGFVARYTPNGSLVWVRGHHSIGPGMAIDADDEVFVVDLGCHLRRLSPEGVERWEVEIAPLRTCFRVAIGESGHLYVGGNDTSLARVNPENGEVLWSHVLGSGNDAVQGLSADATGAVTITGIFESPFDADPGSGENILTNDGWADIFLASFDSEGNHRWAFALSGSESEFLYGAATDEKGALYTTGQFRGTMDFGSGPVAAESPRASFLVKYDASGRHVWTRTSSGGTDGWGFGRSISVDKGLVSIAGNFREWINYHPERLSSAQLNGRGMYVAQFDTAGVYQWSVGLVGAHSVPWAITLDSQRSVYLTGQFLGTVDFDPGPGVFEIRNWDGGGIHFSDQPNFFLGKFGPGGTFTVTTQSQVVPPSSIHLSPPYPHPAKGYAVVSLTLDRPQPVRLVLTDLLGHTVRVISDRYFQAATHALRVDLSGLPAGLYMAHIRGQSAISRTIIIQ